MHGNRFPAGCAVLAALVMSCAACETLLGPTKTDTNWRMHDSARFTLFVRPGSFADESAARLAEVLEDQYSVTIAALNLTYAGHVSGFLYDSASDADLMSDHAGVAYPGNETFRAACVPPLDGNLFVVLSHEANHVLLQSSLGRPGTSFVNEGLASTVISDRFHPYGRTWLYAWTNSHVSEIPPLASLVDDDRWAGFSQDVAYKASASFLAYLLDTNGVVRIRQIYYASSADFGTRFREIYGVTLEEAERAWKAFCANRPA
jgi:hypothetical protein